MVGGGGEDDEAGPVVFNQFAHREEVGGGGSTAIEARVGVRALSAVAGRGEWVVVVVGPRGSAAHDAGCFAVRLV